jgi:mevalonate pyrophosphate decarboxylase
MNIKDNSIVGTIIDYANIKFGMEIKPEEVSAQLKDIGFSDTLRLVDAIKNENDELFSSIIDLSALSESGAGYGTSATGAGSVAGARDQNAQMQNDDRRNTNLALKASRSSGPARTVAGANKQPTAAPSRPVQDPQAAQVASNANQSSSNSQEIERLKQLINKGTR